MAIYWARVHIASRIEYNGQTKLGQELTERKVADKSARRVIPETSKTFYILCQNSIHTLCPMQIFSAEDISYQPQYLQSDRHPNDSQRHSVGSGSQHQNNLLHVNSSSLEIHEGNVATQESNSAWCHCGTVSWHHCQSCTAKWNNIVKNIPETMLMYYHNTAVFSPVAP
jgi:hypothetical protein